MELDWAREKKVLDADPTMVIFVISIIRPNSFIYSKFWSILYASNIQITGKTVFEEDGEGGYRSGRNLLFIMIKMYVKSSVSARTLEISSYVFILR